MNINKVHCLFEQWKDIKGFEGIYQVSNLGRVKSLARLCKANTCGIRKIEERFLSLGKSRNGYFTVILSKKGKHKTVSVHRLVAETFLINPKNKKEVNHKDENKLNNCVSNLEWCDRKYNANYGTGIERCARRKFKSVKMIDLKTNEVLKVFLSQKEAASFIGISNKYISAVCRGKMREAGGYKWRFTSEATYGN